MDRTPTKSVCPGIEEILVVLAPELAAVRATAMALDVFETLEYDRNHIHLILNWVFEKQGLSKTDIEAGINYPVTLIIPHAAEQFVRAINFGAPPVFENPASPLGALFENLAFWASKDSHKKQRPKTPTEAWLRLAKQMRKRRRES
jgi:pilus assembly protein CpaE